MTHAPPNTAHGPTARNLLARHVLMFLGLIAVVVLKGLYFDAGHRAMVRMVFIDLPSALIFLYALPLVVLAGSAMRLKRISGLNFFRITGVMWLILVPSLWRLDLS